MSNVFNVTIDNASTNDGRVENLKRRLSLRKNLILNGDHVHTICCAHFINLVVKEGLKEIDISISRIMVLLSMLSLP